MKKYLSLFLSLCLILGSMGFALADAAFTPGTYKGIEAGFAGDVKATVTVDENVITAIEIVGADETPAIGGAAMTAMAEAYVGKADADAVDAVAGATFTSNAVKAAVAKALAAAAPAAPAASEGFTPGTYEASAQGFGGEVKVIVTVDDSAITAIEIVGSDETPALGGAAITAMAEAYAGKADADAVDSVTGATVTSKAVKEAVGKALEAAQAAAVPAEAPKGFVPGTYEAGAQGFGGEVKVTVTVDDSAITAIEIVGSDETPALGGAAITAMAEAYAGKADAEAVDGMTGATVTSNAVKEAVGKALEAAQGTGEASGVQDTPVSGSQNLSVMPYLVWDPADPDAVTGVNASDGQTYDKAKCAQGCINELEMILNWSEEPFDAEYYKTHEFVAGDAAELSRHGVHAEYLPILQALKAEIREYFVWATPQLASGKDESQLTLFSTLNLHIFQTYYGGLRPSADGGEWMYDDAAMVKQLILSGQGL